MTIAELILKLKEYDSAMEVVYYTTNDQLFYDIEEFEIVQEDGINKLMIK